MVKLLRDEAMSCADPTLVIIQNLWPPPDEHFLHYSYPEALLASARNTARLLEEQLSAVGISAACREAQVVTPWERFREGNTIPSWLFYEAMKKVGRPDPKRSTGGLSQGSIGKATIRGC